MDKLMQTESWSTRLRSSRKNKEVPDIKNKNVEKKNKNNKAGVDSLQNNSNCKNKTVKRKERDQVDENDAKQKKHQKSNEIQDKIIVLQDTGCCQPVVAFDQEKKVKYQKKQGSDVKKLVPSSLQEDTECHHTKAFHHERKASDQKIMGSDLKKSASSSLQKEPLSKNASGIESQKDENYQALTAVDDLDLVSNAEAFLCPVCDKNITCGEGVVLHDCLHSFCKECLVFVIQNSDKAAIRCPFPNFEYSCESYLQDREIKSLVTPEMYQIHVQRSVNFHCQTPHCPGHCIFQDFMNNFLCPFCSSNNCLTCVAIHDGITCEQYQKSVSFNNDAYEEITKENLLISDIASYVDKAANQATLAELEECNLVSNVESFECPICFTNIEGGVGVILHDCLHSFCKECLAGVVQHSETALVICPFQNEDYSCESPLQEREIKSLVTPEIYEKHLQKSVMLAEGQASNSFHCKTPDCPGWCLYEDDVNFFRCPVCSKKNCLTCAVIHEGRNCKQYQDFIAFNCDTNEEAKRTEKYLQTKLKKGEAMECPKCRIIIMKKDGCDFFTCSMCQTEICWVTKGPRWGPGGHGDITGGCKCNYMGKRCHPDCRNCH